MTSLGIHYEVHGHGIPLFLGFPLMASYAQIFGDDAVLRGFLDRLVDRYRVLVVDYPGIGRSEDIVPGDFTVDRASTDLLSVADAAGFDRFAWWGYAWGGAMGLQLASRTERISALVCGGWPPLGGQYADMLRATQVNVADPPASAMVVLRSPAQYAQWVTFYESMSDWPEADALARITCPRLAFAGAEADVAPGGVAIRNASIIRDRRAELEAKGWEVRLIPGQSHGVGLVASVVVPVVREFLDSVT